jgi:hypothetical protein
MSGSRSFRSLVMVASCAGAALGCYLVSLRVASERASLEAVETRIVIQQRELRLLQTEIGTRGRLAQLERWNVKVLALSAPSADQFLKGSFELARLAQPEHKADFQAPVVLAAAPAPEPRRAPVGDPGTDDAGAPTAVSPGSLLHQASLKTETREVPAGTVQAMPRPAAPKSTDRPVTAAKPAQLKSADRPGLAAAKSTGPKPPAKPVSGARIEAAKKTVDKPAVAAAKPVTKPVRLAKTDPLAPLAGNHSDRSRDSTADR